MSDIWGPPTWEFIHNLADKIDETKFNKIIFNVWNNIIILLKNLPCVYCSQHAYGLLKNVNVKSIHSKIVLKNLLYRFHNTVNIKLKKELKKIDIIDKYATVPIKESAYRLIISWRKVANRMTIHEFKNKHELIKVTDEFRKWVINNKHIFIDFE
jgi:hypothetical protein